MVSSARGDSLTLAMFLDLVGGDSIDVLHAPAGLDLPVVAVLIYDTSARPNCKHKISRGDL